jgi:hypothetical protein
LAQGAAKSNYLWGEALLKVLKKPAIFIAGFSEI